MDARNDEPQKKRVAIISLFFISMLQAKNNTRERWRTLP
jgi:hypothetical protein